jgi:exonuclease SbcC
MRPVQLRLRGFGAFRDETVVDFTDTDVFALVGPTGSGKSTVIDAICFALYGSVPRHGEKAVGVVVSVGANEAAVELTFDRAGQRYMVARVVRRTGRDGRATTKEARLERHDPGGAVEVLAGAARELAPAVSELLGLGFDHFTRCVVLPQGEFARFLHDKPADRQALLEQLLGLGLYDVLMKRANQRAAEAQAAVDVGERALADLPAADDESLAAAKRRLTAVETLVGDVAAAQPELDRLRAVAAAALDDARAATELASALEAVVVPAAVAELGERLGEARHELARAEAVDRDAAVARDEAEARLDGYPPLSALEAAAQAHLRIGRGNEVRVQRAEQAEVAEQTRQQAAAAAEVAERAEGDARAALDAVRAAHAAHDLARHLVAGEPCPVCQQTVTTVPRRTRTPALKAAEDGVMAAERARRAATKAAAEAADAARDAHTELGRVDATLQALLDQVADHRDPEALVALLAEATVAASEVAAARDAAATADRAMAAARLATARLDDGLRRAADAFHAQRDSVAAAGPPPPSDDLAVCWSALATWAAEEQPAVAARATAAAAAADEAAVAHRRLADALAARAAALDVPLTGPLAVAVARAEEQARHAVDAIEAARRTRARLIGEIDDDRARYVVAHELARHLASAGFPRWLVGEALDLLVGDASVLLRQLSGGQYSLEAVDGGSDLDVVDHANADERRPVRSLSGGETFQASLAFALALSDHLAALTATTAARLDAIFLDEGFGTLDADSLDTVAATIESLAGGGRMVGIVTHVRELAERVPVRYVVRKGPRTATVERVVA